MPDRSQELMLRAWEDLDTARMNHEAGHERAALNRLNYACFHAVRAVLYDRGYDPSKHRQVLSLIDRELVHEGSLPREQSQTLRDLFVDCQGADYGFGQMTADVKRLLARTETFIENMTDILDESAKDEEEDTECGECA